MTDNEIKKALECHTKEDGVCTGCPLFPDNACVHILTKSALDLINRQQAEIAKLEEYIDRCKSGEEYWVKCLLERPNEAVKEFAERLKMNITINNTSDGYLDCAVDYNCLIEDIDDLVEEMVGDTE